MGYPPVVSRGASTKPNRRALSIAIRYTNLGNPVLELDHAHDDADRIVTLLTTNFGYAKENVTVLKDCIGPQNFHPTRHNIIKAMHDLVDDARPVPGQEEDDKDEVFWPMDVEFHSEDDIENFIRDDILIDSLPAGVSLVIIADCCHSGTIADLPYGHSDHMLRKKNFHVEDRKKSYNRGTERELKPTAVDLCEKQAIKSTFSIPNVVCWSACKDAQLTYNIKSGGGLFVRLLADSIYNNPLQTHRQLLHNISESFKMLMKRYNEFTTRASDDALEKAVPPKPHLSSLGPQEIILELPILETFGGTALPTNSSIRSTANDT
ncbi:caspase domain-containing protein [Irpex lacteus]|nr:caspase domain-containing protein [Irpex lacteus]